MNSLVHQYEEVQGLSRPGAWRGGSDNVKVHDSKHLTQLSAGRKWGQIGIPGRVVTVIPH